MKKAGQLTVTGTIYQNNKVFRTISKTFTVKSENTNGTTPKPQQPTQPASLQKGTKVTDKKSKAVYKVNGNKTVEYNKVNKKAKKATIKVPKKQKKAYQKFLKTKGIGKGVKIK